jgi:hypothetical protein
MMAATAATRTAMTVWVGRLRFVVAIALLWAGLHYVVGWALPHGLDRPLVLWSSPYGPLAGLLLIGMVWAGAAVASILVPARRREEPLFIVGLALTLWAAEGGRQGGTLDDWLIQCNISPGSPTGGPYWKLLVDYVYLLIAVGGACAVAELFSGRAGQAPKTALVRRALGLDAPRDERLRALGAVLIATIVAGLAVLLMMGPPVATTYRGQVYFAVGVGAFAGVFAAGYVVKAYHGLWAWWVPFVLGIVGLLAAALRPALALPPEYQHLNVIPAWALARALPVEMVGIGLVGALWMLRGPTQEVSAEATS